MRQETVVVHIYFWMPRHDLYFFTLAGVRARVYLAALGGRSDSPQKFPLDHPQEPDLGYGISGRCWPRSRSDQLQGRRQQSSRVERRELSRLAVCILDSSFLDTTNAAS